MVKTSAVYKGELRCEAAHGPSGFTLETDAPRDNQGRGEQFSPTDLVGAALSTCILTTMAIVAKRDGVPFESARAEVEKEMVSSPSRRIGSLEVTVHMPGSLSPEVRRKLEAAAHHCPVHNSLSPEVRISLRFIYD
jgi:putative redox protein